MAFGAPAISVSGRLSSCSGRQSGRQAFQVVIYLALARAARTLPKALASLKGYSAYRLRRGYAALRLGFLSSPFAVSMAASSSPAFAAVMTASKTAPSIALSPTAIAPLSGVGEMILLP